MSYYSTRSFTDTNRGRHQKFDVEIQSVIHELFNEGFLTKQNLSGKTKYQVWMFPKPSPMNMSEIAREQFIKANPPKVIYQKVSKVDDYEYLFFVPKFKFKDKKEYLKFGHLENWQITPTTIDNFDEFDIKMSRDINCYFNNSKRYRVINQSSVAYYLGHETSERFFYRDFHNH